MDVSGLTDGTVYPALRRLEEAGCLDSQWEDEEEAAREKRPQRCYYRLTSAGEEMLDKARERFPGLQWMLPETGAPEPGKA